MHFVYILKCGDNSFYTGYTPDIEKRLLKHRNGTGAKYVKSRLPVELIYSESFETKQEALKREYEIKHWSRDMKIKRLGLSSFL